jgi:methyltransferase-like protein
LKPASTPQSPVAYSESLKEEMLERFENLAGEAVLSVASPLLKAVCLCLGERWPQSWSFDELMARVYELLIMTDQEAYYEILSPANLGEVKTMLAEFYLKKIVELSIYPPQLTLHVSEYPLASPLARLQSQQSKQVTNLRYEIFTLNFATREVLSHLDGKHDRAALLEVLRQSVIEGDLVLYRGEDQKTLIEVNDEELHNLLSSQLDEILFSLAHKAYLIN